MVTPLFFYGYIKLLQCYMLIVRDIVQFGNIQGNDCDNFAMTLQNYRSCDCKSI